MSMFSSSNVDDDFDDDFDFDDKFDGDDDGDADIVVNKRMASNTDDDDDSDDDNDDDDSNDNVGQASVEIDVATLIAELEAENVKGVDSHGDLRKRLDEILERKQHKHDLDDFDEYDID